MIQYIVILLDDTSVSFCHYQNKKNRRRLMPLETLKSAIVYAMKENMSIQFVYPDYPLLPNYEEIIDSTDHIKIKPAKVADDADVVVFNSITEAKGFVDYSIDEVSYVIRTKRCDLFAEIDDIIPLLRKIRRLNIVITDVESFTEDDFKTYSKTLQILSKSIEALYIEGSTIQLNLLTDRMMLNKMNNCGAGDASITLAPNGKFYVCPAFYVVKENDEIGNLNTPIGDLENGLDIKNSQLYKLDHAPLCRHCDAYQCKRCVWLNRKTTFEVNTPSHEQCVMAHLERNASRELLNSIRQHGTFLPDQEEIQEITYLDPFDVRKEWE